MIVRFDFKTHMELFVESYHARVVFKHADAPIIIAQRFADRLRGSKNGFLQHVFVLTFITTGFSIRRWAFVMNPTCQSFVTAVFRPCLRDGFQFDVRWITANGNELVPDRLHFD